MSSRKAKSLHMNGTKITNKTVVLHCSYLLNMDIDATH